MTQINFCPRDLTREMLIPWTRQSSALTFFLSFFNFFFHFSFLFFFTIFSFFFHFFFHFSIFLFIFFSFIIIIFFLNKTKLFPPSSYQYIPFSAGARG